MKKTRKYIQTKKILKIILMIITIVLYFNMTEQYKQAYNKENFFIVRDIKIIEAEEKYGRGGTVSTINHGAAKHIKQRLDNKIIEVKNMLKR